MMSKKFKELSVALKMSIYSVNLNANKKRGPKALFFLSHLL